MTRQKLKQIRHLKREIELLEDQILNLEAGIVTDKVRGSLPHHPWIETSFKITGFDQVELSQKMERLKRKMQRRVDDLIELRTEIIEFVEGIDDSLLRQVIILRHVNGLTWEQVAAHIGGGNTADSVRKMHDRFLKGVKAG
jgi:hypothetical protein